MESGTRTQERLSAEMNHAVSYYMLAYYKFCMSYLYTCTYIIIMTYYNYIGVAVTRGNVAAIAGGVVGGIVVMLLIILGAIVLLVVFRRMGKGELK